MSLVQCIAIVSLKEIIFPINANHINTFWFDPKITKKYKKTQPETWKSKSRHLWPQKTASHWGVRSMLTPFDGFRHHFENQKILLNIHRCFCKYLLYVICSGVIGTVFYVLCQTTSTDSEKNSTIGTFSLFSDRAWENAESAQMPFCLCWIFATIIAIFSRSESK